MVLPAMAYSSGLESVSRWVAGSYIFAIGKKESVLGFFFGSLKHRGLWN